jgi:hypothetical protein
MEIYHAQKRFYNESKPWADRIQALDIPSAPADPFEHTLIMKPTADGFEAAMSFNPDGAGKQTWTIGQGSRILRKP